MSDQLVVLAMHDGMADTSIVHLPAIYKTSGRCGQGGYRFSFDSHTWPPTTWPSLCGQVLAGSVYNRGGPLERTPVCYECRIAKVIEDAKPRLSSEGM